MGASLAVRPFSTRGAAREPPAENWANAAPWRTAGIVRVSPRWFGPMLGLLATLGCDPRREKAALPALARPAAPTASTPPMRDRIAYELYRVRQRFGPPPGTLERVRQRCPDQSIR